MAVAVNAFYEERLQHLFELGEQVKLIFEAAGLEYRIVGGLATYLYVEQRTPDAGRLTKDIDVLVRREDLIKLTAAAEAFGFVHRHAAELDMLVRREEPSARRAVHLVLAGELVKPGDFEPTPALAADSASDELKGLKLLPLHELVRMKLVSYRLKDQVHVKDIQEAGLITPDLIAGLPVLLRERLTRVLEAD